MAFLDSRRVAEIAARIEGLGQVRQIAFLGEGEFSAAWLINEVIVCRFAKHEAAAASLQRECCLLPDLAQLLPLPIPQPRCHVVPMVPPLLVGVHRLLEGEPLSRERFAGLSARRQAACAHSIGVFLAALHHSDLDRARACGVDTRDYRARFGAAAAAFERQLAARLDVAERAYIRSTFESFLAGEVEQLRSIALLHADLSPPHALWDVRRARVCGIIDFGDMIIGDPAEELAGLYDDFGPAFVRAVLRNLPHHDREALARRVYRLYELLSIEWAVGVLEQGRSEAVAPVLAQAVKLRLDAHREPWRRLL
jgi:aminoglycoside 2''-phosphotransferase